MTILITYRPSDVWVKAIKKKGDLQGFDYVSSVWESTPNMVLSTNTSFKQISLQALKDLTKHYIPTYEEGDTIGESGLCIVDGDGVEKYLKITDVWLDSMWLLMETVPYSNKFLQIKGIHPLSLCAKNIATNTFVKDLGPIILSSANVEECPECKDVGELHQCGTYDEEGETLHAQALCQSCREIKGFRHLCEGVYFDMDISSKLDPGHNWAMSVRFGGPLTYNFETTAASSGMGMEDRKNYRTHKKDGVGSPFMGVELEVSGRRGAYTELHSYVKEAYRRAAKGSIAIVGDGSLPSNNRSFEIVTVPAKMHYLKSCLAPLFKDDLFTKEASKNYGMHVHIDRKSLSTMQLAKMSTFINIKENREFVQFIAGRKTTSYCAYEGHLGKLTDKVNSKRKKQTTLGDSKHVAISFMSGPTIELRMFCTPDSYEDFCMKVEFCEALVLYTKNIAGFKDLSYSSFINWLKREPRGYPSLVKKVSTLHYLTTPLPLSTVTNISSTVVLELLQKIKIVERRTSRLSSKVFRHKVKMMFKKTTLLKGLSRKRVTLALLGRLYKRCRKDKDTFWRVLDYQCAETLPESMQFEYANRTADLSGLLLTSTHREIIAAVKSQARGVI